MKFTVCLLGLAALPSLVSAAGINCKGSIKCGGAAISGWGGDDKDHAVTLSEYIHSLDDGTWIPDRALIACTRTICAFLQNFGAGIWAKEVKRMARNIVEHGCKRCGTSPGDYPHSNDGTSGELTFNYVNDRCGHVLDGVCRSFADSVIKHDGEERLAEEKKEEKAVEEAAEKKKDDKKLAEMIAEKVKEELAEENGNNTAPVIFEEYHEDAPEEKAKDPTTLIFEKFDKDTPAKKEDDASPIIFEKFHHEVPAEKEDNASSVTFVTYHKEVPAETWQEEHEAVETFAPGETVRPRRLRRRGMANVGLSS